MLRARAFFAFISCALFLFPAHAETLVSYEGKVQGDSLMLEVTQAYSTDDGKEYNYFQLASYVPEGSEVLSVTDSLGPVKDFEFDGRELNYESNRGPLRSMERITINAVAPGVDESLSPLKSFHSFFIAFDDGNPNHVELEFPEEVLSVLASPGFSFTINGRKVTFEGNGTLEAIVNYSNAGVKHKHFVGIPKGVKDPEKFQAVLSDADKLIQLIPRLLGLVPPQTRFPVIALQDEDYDRLGRSGISGAHYTQGRIVVEESSVYDENGVVSSEIIPLLVHESLHAFDWQLLQRDSSKMNWFDEGLATYIERLAAFASGERWPGAFAAPVTFLADGSEDYTITLVPKATGDALWNYYQEGDYWVEKWAGEQSLSPEREYFAYALSNLAMQQKIKRDGVDSFRNAYKSLAAANRPAEGETLALQLVQAMNLDLKPCKNESREAFDACIAELNAFTPSIPSSAQVTPAANAKTFQEAFGDDADFDSLIAQTLARHADAEKAAVDAVKKEEELVAFVAAALLVGGAVVVLLIAYGVRRLLRRKPEMGGKAK